MEEGTRKSSILVFFFLMPFDWGYLVSVSIELRKIFHRKRVDRLSESFIILGVVKFLFFRFID